MHTCINGQNVPVDVAFGLAHQVVREYDAGEEDGYRWPAGATSLGLPWFRDFREAVRYLQDKPYAGYIQSHVLTEDGTKPSWVTAGSHYRKVGGDRHGPVSCVTTALLVPTAMNAAALKTLAALARTVEFDARDGKDRLIEMVASTQAVLAWLKDADIPGADEALLRAVQRALDYDCASVRVVVQRNEFWSNPR